MPGGRGHPTASASPAYGGGGSAKRLAMPRNSLNAETRILPPCPILFRVFCGKGWEKMPLIERPDQEQRNRAVSRGFTSGHSAATIE